MDLKKKEQEFKNQVFKQPFTPDILEEFFDYWTEPNKSHTKLRFELEKTWDLSRRLKRWQAIRDSRPDFMKKQVAKAEQVMIKIPTNDMERLEAFYTAYCLKPTAIPFELFDEYFEFMKAQNLLKELSQDEKDILKLVYGNKSEKLRSAWVQKTFDYLYLTNFRFKK